MTVLAVRTLRSLVAVVATAGLVALGVSQHACVLLSDGGALPRLPDSRPTIVHSSLVPGTSAVLVQWPTRFIVPVELSDPTVTFVYAAFVDNGIVESPRSSDFVPSNEDPGRTGRIRTIDVVIPEPAELARCYKIEIVVALRLNEKDGHTPDERGGDIATWFYNPSGDLKGCPALDAGIDAAFDSGEGGPL
jgi:hypothetical protein